MNENDEIHLLIVLTKPNGERKKGKVWERNEYFFVFFYATK